MDFLSRIRVVVVDKCGRGEEAKLWLLIKLVTSICFILTS